MPDPCGEQAMQQGTGEQHACGRGRLWEVAAHSGERLVDQVLQVGMRCADSKELLQACPTWAPKMHPPQQAYARAGPQVEDSHMRTTLGTVNFSTAPDIEQTLQTCPGCSQTGPRHPACCTALRKRGPTWSHLLLDRVPSICSVHYTPPPPPPNCFPWV